ncbi:MAG: serine hydrolase domain-containing protein [Gemmatimonadales bacterium]
MKTLVSTRASLFLYVASCAAAILLGAAAPQSQPAQIGRPEVRTAKPSSAVFVPDPFVIDRNALAAATEGAWLQKLTTGFLRRCTGKSVGCAIAAVGPNGVWSEGATGAARRTPDLRPRGLTATDKITMASVSKTFTGVALQRLLYTKRISVDSRIGPFLPTEWTRTAAVDNVTFRQLLTHTSGLPCSGITDDQLKTCLATANPAPSPFAYKNENFALMRILIPRINGLPLPRPGTIPPYAALYRNYVNAAVFAPAGLPQMECKPTDLLPALSYKSATANKWDFSQVGPGEVWGDMGAVCGSQGWSLSAHQMAQTMRAIMTPDKILPASLVDRMKKENLAVYFGDHGDGLQSWNHGGYHPAEWNNGEINTLIIHFNNGVSVGVIINSPYGSGTTGGNYFADLIASVKAAG